MSQNITQNAVFGEVADGSTALIFRTRGISVLSVTGTTIISQLSDSGEAVSSLTIGVDKSIEITADSGNLLNNIRIAPSGGSAQFVLLGGSVTNPE
jgi:hypothetical protein